MQTGQRLARETLPRARKKLEAEMAGQQYTTADRVGFRWVGGTREGLPGPEGSDIGSYLRPWPGAYGLPWTRWGAKAPPRRGVEQIRVVLASGEVVRVGDIRSPWSGGSLFDAKEDAAELEVLLATALVAEGREQWSDVARILGIARRYVEDEGAWTSYVGVPRRTSSPTSFCAGGRNVAA